MDCPLSGLPPNSVSLPRGILSCHNHLISFGVMLLAFRVTSRDSVCVTRDTRSASNSLNLPASFPHSLVRTSFASLRPFIHLIGYVAQCNRFARSPIALMPAESLSPARKMRLAVESNSHSASVGLYDALG